MEPMISDVIGDSIPALITACYLFLLLLKYALYDVGFLFNDVLSMLAIFCIRMYFLMNDFYKSHNFVQFIMYVIFDRELLTIGNVLLLFGITCLRAQFDILSGELVMLICGLVCLLTRWYNIGSIIITQALIFFTVIINVCLVAKLFTIAFNHSRTFRRKTIRLLKRVVSD